jgi:hypothetical protein
MRGSFSSLQDDDVKQVGAGLDGGGQGYGEEVVGVLPGVGGGEVGGG